MPIAEGHEEPLQRLEKLVHAFLARPDAEPFAEPVDWRALELFDYLEIIDKPMDLGTIARKLERQQYVTAQQCVKDIRLIWENCMTYNAEGSDFWLLGKAFRRRFEDRYRKIKLEFGLEEEEVDDASADDSDSAAVVGGAAGELDPEDALMESSKLEATLDARSLLASRLVLLHGPEWGHVMAMLERECPAALESLHQRNTAAAAAAAAAAADHVEINLDALDAILFAKLATYVQEMTAHRDHVLTTPALHDISGKRRRRR